MFPARFSKFVFVFFTFIFVTFLLLFLSHVIFFFFIICIRTTIILLFICILLSVVAFLSLFIVVFFFFVVFFLHNIHSVFTLDHFLFPLKYCPLTSPSYLTLVLFLLFSVFTLSISLPLSPHCLLPLHHRLPLKVPHPRMRKR